MNQWQIILDVVMVAIIVISIVVGTVRGIIKSFFKSTKILIVILLTALIAPLLVGACQELFVNDMIEGKITPALVQKAEQMGEGIDVDALTEELPGVVANLISMAELDQYFASLEGSAVEIATEMGTKIEEIAINALSRVISYIAVFIIAFIVCTIAIHFISKLGEIPILKRINHILGFIWGTASAYITVSLIVFILPLILGADFIAGTYVTRWLCEIGFLSIL